MTDLTRDNDNMMNVAVMRDNLMMRLLDSAHSCPWLRSSAVSRPLRSSAKCWLMQSGCGLALGCPRPDRGCISAYLAHEKKFFSWFFNLNKLSLHFRLNWFSQCPHYSPSSRHCRGPTRAWPWPWTQPRSTISSSSSAREMRQRGRETWSLIPSLECSTLSTTQWISCGCNVSDVTPVLFLFGNKY